MPPVHDGTRHTDSTAWIFRSISFAAITALVLFLCWKMAAPFLSAFTWALALAVACAPLRNRLFARIPRLPATLLIIVVVIFVIAIPVTLIARQMFQELARAQESFRDTVAGGDWRDSIAAHRWLGPVLDWADRTFDLSDAGRKIAGAVAGWIAPAMAMSISVISQGGITILVLFFFLRDQDVLLDGIRRLSPLGDSETAFLFARVSTAVQSAVYGRLFIGCIQGFLGGVAFASLGLPAPVLWGAVMSILATLPTLGAFVVWIPAALYLTIDGHWIRALILTIWGIAVINPVDNILYPILVGARMGLHPLVLFVAFVGGLVAFGPAGLILGPCVVALAAGIAEVWQVRSTAGSIEIRN